MNTMLLLCEHNVSMNGRSYSSSCVVAPAVLVYEQPLVLQRLVSIRHVSPSYFQQEVTLLLRRYVIVVVVYLHFA